MTIHRIEAKLPGQSKLRARQRKGIDYVVRNGRVIAVLRKPSTTPLKQHNRRRFKPEFVMVPDRWITELRRSNSSRAYDLALLILKEALRCEYTGGEIILSQTTVLHMSRQVKLKAARELERLRLIDLHRDGKKALRVTPLHTLIHKQ
jgi:hypothetical protein